MKQSNPIFTVIAGVNGSGKTTFALDYFKDSNTIFVNADSIAMALSSNNPDISQFRAGKLMLAEMQKHINKRQSFAVETTLASKNYLKVIKHLKRSDWKIELLYLYLPSVELSVQRVAERVKNGGHNIGLKDIKRRYSRSISNLMNVYFDTIDDIICLNNKDDSHIIFSKYKGKTVIYNQASYDDIVRVKNVR